MCYPDAMTFSDELQKISDAFHYDNDINDHIEKQAIEIYNEIKKVLPSYAQAGRYSMCLSLGRDKYAVEPFSGEIPFGEVRERITELARDDGLVVTHVLHYDMTISWDTKAKTHGGKKPGLTDEQRDFLTRRIVQLKSKMANVGPYRQAGIHKTIQSMQKQLKDNEWRPKA